MIYQATARYDKTLENGSVKKVNEPFLVEAESPTDCEARLVEHLSAYVGSDFVITAIKRVSIEECFGGSGWYWLVKA